MNTIQRLARWTGCLVLAVAPLTGCSDDTAPEGATISTPGALTVPALDHAVTPTTLQTAAPLEFQALDKDGNPLPGVKIRFFGGDSTTMLSHRDGVTPLNASDNVFFETTTDERGLSPTDVYAVFVVPGCSTTTDITGTASVTASIGTASALWTASFTNTCS